MTAWLRFFLVLVGSAIGGFGLGCWIGATLADRLRRETVG